MCGRSEGITMADNLTLSQACREFGISKSTMHRWVNIKKVIPASQPVPGGNKYVKRSDVADLLNGEKAEKPKRRKTILSRRG
jgi:transposase-like protein